MLPSLLPPMVLTNYVLSTIVFVVPIIFPTPRLTGRPLVIPGRADLQRAEETSSTA